MEIQDGKFIIKEQEFKLVPDFNSTPIEVSHGFHTAYICKAEQGLYEITLRNYGDNRISNTCEVLEYQELDDMIMYFSNHLEAMVYIKGNEVQDVIRPNGSRTMCAIDYGMYIAMVEEDESEWGLFTLTTEGAKKISVINESENFLLADSSDGIFFMREDYKPHYIDDIDLYRKVNKFGDKLVSTNYSECTIYQINDDSLSLLHDNLVCLPFFSDKANISYLYVGLNEKTALVVDRSWSMVEVDLIECSIRLDKKGGKYRGSIGKFIYNGNTYEFCDNPLISTDIKSKEHKVSLGDNSPYLWKL